MLQNIGVVAEAGGSGVILYADAHTTRAAAPQGTPALLSGHLSGFGEGQLYPSNLYAFAPPKT